MQQQAQSVGLVMAAPAEAERAFDQDRWPAPLATLFIVGTSAILWTAILLAAALVLG